MLQAVCPIPSALLVHTDGHNVATALVTLDPEVRDQWRTGAQPVRHHPAVRAYVRSGVDVPNGRLNPWETIREYWILDHDHDHDHDVTVEDDELTPSRKVIAR